MTENPESLVCPTCAGFRKVRGKLRNGSWPIVTCWRCGGTGKWTKPENTATPDES